MNIQALIYDLTNSKCLFSTVLYTKNQLFIFKNYMELKSEPEMRKQLHKERMFFWDKMVWEEKERLVEKKQLYIMATQFLIKDQTN